MGKNQKGFSVIEVLLILVIVGVLGFIGWYVWQNKVNKQSIVNTKPSITHSVPNLITKIDTSKWVADSNSCFKYSFKAPANLQVKIIDVKTVSCSLSPNEIGSFGVNDWASVSATLGNSYVESLPKGLYMDVLTPMPINNSNAMKFIGLQTSNSVSALLKGIASAAVGDGNNSYIGIRSSSIITINGHQAALVKMINPDNPPSNFKTVDTPYCPCTSEEITLDTGAGSVLRINSNRLNSDKQSGDTIEALFASFKFN